MKLETWSQGDWTDRVPAPVRQCLQLLSDREIPAYVVGGAVRSLYWGDPVSDWDIAAGTTVDRLLACFPGAAAPGLRFGTVIVAPGIEVTVWRRESAYGDGRHPDAVEPTANLAEDLARRDFTVNAVAWDGHGTLVAPLGARDDLEHRLLKAVGHPEQRFREDALRILRLARFYVETGCSIDAVTFDAAVTLGPHSLETSRERRLGEAIRIARGDLRRWPILRALNLTEALELEAVWPETAWLKGRVPPDALSALYALLRSFRRVGPAAVGWVNAWPLPRAWRRTLGSAVVHEPETLAEWQVLARTPGPAQVLFGTLGQAMWGGATGEWEPVPVQLSVAELQTVFGLQGRDLGRCQRWLQALVARFPEANRHDILHEKIRAWMNTGGNVAD